MASMDANGLHERTFPPKSGIDGNPVSRIAASAVEVMMKIYCFNSAKGGWNKSENKTENND